MEKHTDTEDSGKLRQVKEFNTFCKKVRVNNLIWFDALCKTKKYNLFYEWRREKYNSVEKKRLVRLRHWGMEGMFLDLWVVDHQKSLVYLELFWQK